MELEMGAECEGELGAPVQDVAQEAIDAVASTYTHEADIDVEEHLRVQLSSRGIKAVHESWLSEVGREIRSGHRVQVGRSDGSVDPT